MAEEEREKGWAEGEREWMGGGEREIMGERRRDGRRVGVRRSEREGRDARRRENGWAEVKEERIDWMGGGEGERMDGEGEAYRINGRRREREWMGGERE